MTKSDSTRNTERNDGSTAATASKESRVNHRSTLGDISHTHPDTDEAFGTAMAYKRGPVVAADGGERNAVDADDTGVSDDGDEPEDEDRMRDVDHAPPEGDDVNRVHQRGGEGRDGQ